MERTQIELFTTKGDVNVTEAMKKIDNNAKGTLFVVDSDFKLIGAVSDGDIRRWLIKTGDLSASIISIMNTNPQYINYGEINKLQELFDKLHVHVVPVLNGDGVIVDLIFDEKNNEADICQMQSSLKGVSIVIMAGGKGTRLYPYTKILPKPLIPINDVPIIERIINEYRKYDADNIYVSVNYKKEMIKSYFNELDYKLRYIEENKPLGTAGSLNLISDKIDGHVIITNCDILIRADYSDIMDYHKKSGNAVTIVSAMIESTIPYGVIHSGENGKILYMEEKPKLQHIVNTGMYIVDARYLKKIPKDTFYHMTDFVRDLLSQKLPVGMYPISEESFLDMGEFVELQRMEEKLRESL